MTFSATVSDTGDQQADAILLYRYAASVSDKVGQRPDMTPPFRYAANTPASIHEIPLTNGTGTGFDSIVVDPGATVGFDARTVRRNALGLTVCSFDVGPNAYWPDPWQ